MSGYSLGPCFFFFLAFCRGDITWGLGVEGSIGGVDGTGVSFVVRCNRRLGDVDVA